MLRFFLCISAILTGFFTVGCAPSIPSLKLAPEVVANEKGANSIVWGLIQINAIYNADSGIMTISVPGLLAGAIEDFMPSAKIVFYEEATGKEYTIQVRDTGFRLFAYALPKGTYRLIVNVKWPDGSGKIVSDGTVKCYGDGKLIFIGFLNLGIKGGTPFLYDTSEDFEKVVMRFRVDNPEYTGEVERQVIAGTVVFMNKK